MTESLQLRNPTDYRTQAAECVRRAEHAKSAAHRLILLQQAQSLLRMADEAALLADLSIGEASPQERCDVSAPKQ
jgi:hypothetical protein